MPTPSVACRARPGPAPCRALLLACLLGASAAFGETATEPDAGAREALLQLQSQAGPWLRVGAAMAGEPARLRMLTWQARFAAAAQATDADARWRHLADAAGDAWPARASLALSELSNRAYRRGDIASVEAVENEALAQARRLGNRKEEAASIYGLALAAAGSGRTDQAEPLFREAIALWETLDEPRGLAAAQRGLGRLLETRGRYAEAVALQVAALEALLRDGRAIDQSESYYSLARLFQNLGDHEAARRSVDEAIRLMGDAPPDFPLGLNLVLRSDIVREQGDADAALADAEAALAAFERAGSPLGGGIGRLALGRALSATGRGEAGLAELREGRALAVQVGERVLESDLALAEAVALVELARHREALRALDDAARIAEALGLDRLKLDVALERERALSALGRPAEALAASKQAFALRDRLGSLGDLGQLASEHARLDAATRARFMDLAAGAAGPDADTAPAGGLPAAWAWGLVLPSLLLAWGLVRLRRHARRLSREKHEARAREQALEAERHRLRRQVAVDGLTGTLTRQGFAAELESLLAHAHRNYEPVALLVLDLDNFKPINDQHGHLAGDGALRLVAGIAREKLRSEDLLGRFGGDEFLIAVRGADPAQAAALAERIRTDVLARGPAQEPALPGLSLSAGVAVADAAHGYAADLLFHRADTALFAAKRAGRNRVQRADLLDDDAPAPGRPRLLGLPAGD